MHADVPADEAVTVIKLVGLKRKFTVYTSHSTVYSSRKRSMNPDKFEDKISNMNIPNICMYMYIHVYVHIMYVQLTISFSALVPVTCYRT